MRNKVVIFDLDDTLFKEIDFLKSAYKEIAVAFSEKTNTTSDAIHSSMLDDYFNGKNVFQNLLETHTTLDIDVTNLLNIYRNHVPNIKLSEDTLKVLNKLKDSKITMGLITDGRSTQQRNKIKALGINKYFQHLIISEEFGSEKPNPENYKYFEEKHGDAQYYYIGDNTKKDFISPNALNWVSICLLDDGNNIHKQDFSLVKENLPQYRVENLSEILAIINY